VKQRIIDFLPRLYDGLLPALFFEHIPAERLATCGRCVMCRRPEKPRAPSARYFKPDAKCCTYYPSLPNYLAGGLLSDPALEEGGKRIRELLARGRGAAPQALGSPRGYDRFYSSLGDHGFGRWRRLLCPYFRRGTNDCAVWPYRNAVCATYFCRHVRGLPGEAFWRATQRYLAIIEKTLSEYALQSIGGPCGSRDLEKAYRCAHEVVRNMDACGVERIGGAQARAALAEVEDSLRGMLSARLPAVLRINPRLRVRRRQDRVYLDVPGYLTYCLPRRAWDALRGFDGGADYKGMLRSLAMSRGFLVALYRAGILKPPSSRASSSRRIRPSDASR